MLSTTRSIPPWVYAALSYGRPILRKSEITKLNPRLYGEGFIRSEAVYVLLNFCRTKCDHWVTKLFVKHCRESSNHSARTNFTLHVTSKSEKKYERGRASATCAKGRRTRLRIKLWCQFPKQGLHSVCNPSLRPQWTMLDPSSPFKAVD